MKRYAIVDTTSRIVMNVVEYEAAPGNPPPGFGEGVTAVQHDRADPSWGWDGQDLVPVEDEMVVKAPQSISDRQFFQQLAVEGVITEAEALASNAAVIPAPLLSIVNAMPKAQQFAAKMLISGATMFERHHPMTEAIGAARGMSADEIDAFFSAAAVL